MQRNEIFCQPTAVYQVVFFSCFNFLPVIDPKALAAVRRCVLEKVIYIEKGIKFFIFSLIVCLISYIMLFLQLIINKRNPIGKGRKKGDSINAAV